MNFFLEALKNKTPSNHFFDIVQYYLWKYHYASWIEFCNKNKSLSDWLKKAW